jgi:DNA-binding HxlR family transcriptional regulator
MRWDEIDQQLCSVARSLAIVGDRWTLMILRDAFLGTRRFEDFHRQLGVSRHRLSDRLSKLVQHGVLRKVRYQDRPTRYEYRLTKKGVALQPVMLTLAQWGDQWCDDGRGAPVEYRHRSCGKVTTPKLCCSECGELIRPAELTPIPGPALRTALDSGEGMYTDMDANTDPTMKIPPMLRPVAGADQ